MIMFRIFSCVLLIGWLSSQSHLLVNANEKANDVNNNHKNTNDNNNIDNNNNNDNIVETDKDFVPSVSTDNAIRMSSNGYSSLNHNFSYNMHKDTHVDMQLDF